MPKNSEKRPGDPLKKRVQLKSEKDAKINHEVQENKETRLLACFIVWSKLKVPKGVVVTTLIMYKGPLFVKFWPVLVGF